MSDAKAVAKVAEQAEALRKLRERFQATIGRTLDALGELGQRIALAPDAPEVVDALRRELHRVHGTAGSYGYTEASRLAGELEVRAVRWAADPLLDREKRSTLVQQLVVALGFAFGRESAPADASAPPKATVSTVVVVAAAAHHVAGLRGEAAARGIRLAAVTRDQAQAPILRDLAPSLIVIPAAFALSFVETAWLVGAPLVALEDRPRAERGDGTALRDAGINTVDVTEGYAGVFELAVDAAARDTLGCATVLALDDDPLILGIVSFVLTAPDVRVRTISDPSLLDNALAECEPSLLLMDINMPGGTGIEITKRLRADPRYHDLPIVLLSSETDVASRGEALEAGADEFISKPIAVTELRARVTDRLGRVRTTRLARGLHPLTTLPMGPRAGRDAASAYDALVAEGEPVVVAVMRPVPHAADENRGWIRETARLARALAPNARLIGHLDETVLVAILQLDATQAMAKLAALQGESAGSPSRWLAGVASRDDLAHTDFRSARRAAEEALDIAQSAGENGVHRWRAEEALLAPDVVVVEDDPALSDMMQYALRATGFTCRAFGNGRTALEYLLAAKTQGRQPIVLLDVDLPGMDGYSLHERLTVARAGDYSVVFVTVHAAESDQLRALKGGAIDFITKPLNLRILMAKMQSWAVQRGRPTE